MNDRQPGGLLFVILALVGASFFVASPPARERTGSPSPPGAATATATGGASHEQLIRLPLARFLELDSTKSMAAALTEQNARLGALIVCVPDPLDASIGFRFDLFLGTLKKALSTERFVLDNYYLPWEGYLERRPDNRSSPAPRLYAETPGVLLFRRSPSDGKDLTDLLVVYLVGDTAVSGIHKAAFGASVEEVQRLVTKPPEMTLTIPVLGPVFSGSGESLARACKSARDSNEHLRFALLSGSATSIDPDRFNARSGSPFLSTTLPARLVKGALLDYVQEGHTRLGPDVLRIAWLHESSTGYGIGSVSSRKNPDSNASEDSDRKMEVVDFPFPLHISHVRSAHKSDGVEQQPSLLQKRYVRLPLDEHMESRDAVPRFTPNMTAATVDLLLARTLTTIQREGFPYVGITATDPRDRIFLAGLLRDHCPNVQILIVGADLLYVHPEARRHLKGTIIGSAYPQFFRNQSWSFPWGTQWNSGKMGYRHTVFASQVEQGVYNAALLLLNPRFIDTRGVAWLSPEWPWQSRRRPWLCPGRPWEKGGPTPALVSYGKPFDWMTKSGLRPPVWISVVGNQDLWPLTCRTDPNPEDAATLRRYTASLRREAFADAGVVGRNLGPPAYASILEPSRESRLPLVALALLALSASFLYFRRIDWDIARYLSREDSLTDGSGIADKKERDRANEEAKRDRRRRSLYQIVLFTPLSFVLGLVAVLLEVPACFRKCFTPELDPGGPDLLLLSTMAATGGAWFLAFARFKSESESLSSRLKATSRLWSKLKLILKWMVEPAPRNVIIAVAFFVVTVVICIVEDAFEGRVLLVGVVLAGGWTLAAAVDAAIRGLAGQVHAGPRLGRLTVPIVCLFYALVVMQATEWMGFVDSTVPERTVLLFERTFHVFSGVSAFAPGAFLALAFCSWGYCRLKRFHHRTEYFVEPPWPREENAPVALETPEKRWNWELVIRIDRTAMALERFLAGPCRVLRERIPGSFGLGFGVAIALLLHASTREALPTYEYRWFSILLWIGLGLFVLAWLHWFFEVAFLSFHVLSFLRRAFDLPLSGAFGRLPDSIASMIGRFSSSRPFRRSLLTVPARYLTELCPPGQQGALQSGPGEIEPRVENGRRLDAHSDVQKMLAARSGDLTRTRKEVQVKLRDGARALWQRLLPVWDRRSVSESFPETLKGSDEEPAATAQDESTSVEKAGATGSPRAVSSAEEWVKLAEDFLAMQVVFYVSGYFRHLWNLLSWLMVASLLFLLAVVSYPLQPQTTLLTWAMGMVIATGVAGLVIFVRMEHDRLITLVTEKKANRIQFDRQFFQTVLTWLFPVLAVIAVRAFPELGSWFGSLLDPLASPAAP